MTVRNQTAFAFAVPASAPEEVRQQPTAARPRLTVLHESKVDLRLGDCLEVLRTLADNSIDAVVTDPPYGLEFMGREWDSFDGEAIDPAFGHWLAGLVDGEGCFHIKKSSGQAGFSCEFYLQLRSDDAPILKTIHETLGIGRLSLQERGPDQNPMARFVVATKDGCKKLKALFQMFPLRAKKARDLMEWSKALDAWCLHQLGDDWSEMESARGRLQSARKFQPAGVRIDQYQAWCFAWGREVFRVLKPGGHLLAFGATRTYHRLAAGIEDAGFEIRDSLHWVYGSGFPKSLDVSKAIDKQAGATRQATGIEPRRPNPRAMMPCGDGERSCDASTRYDAPATPAAAKWSGWGTALKPAHEPIVLARKPLTGTVAENVLEHGTGGINVDGCRINPGELVPGGGNGKAHNGGRFGAAETHGVRPVVDSHTKGRWPANVIFSHVSSEWHTLKEGISIEARKAIHSYYGAEQAMSALRDSDPGNAEPTCEKEILLEGVRWRLTPRNSQEGMDDDPMPGMRAAVPGDSCMGAQRSEEILQQEMLRQSNGHAQDAPGYTAHGNDTAEDERTRQGEEGQGEFLSMEGREIQARGGIHARDDRSLASACASVRQTDDKGHLHPRAPSDSGGIAGAAASAVGDCASPERDKDGQSAREFDGRGQGGSLSGTSEDRAGAVIPSGRGNKPTGRELRLEVEVGCIPRGWLEYFEFSHADGCVKVGTRRVNQSGGPGWNGKSRRASMTGDAREGASLGLFQAGLGDQRSRQDPDGTEEIPAWDCVPGCPVAELDRQSGKCRSGGHVNPSHSRQQQPGVVQFSGKALAVPGVNTYSDTGGSSRFFKVFPGEEDAPFRYVAKASRREREAGCEHLPARTGAQAVEREPDTAGLDNPRAGAGRTISRMKYPAMEAQWVYAVLSQSLSTEDQSQLQKVTEGSTTELVNGSVWSMCWCGSPSTDPFHPAIISIIEMKTNSTIESKICSWSTRPHTNGCMGAVFASTMNGGNLASCAGTSSTSASPIGICLEKDGRFTEDAGLVTFIKSWLTSKPEKGGGHRVGVVHNFHPT